MVIPVILTARPAIFGFGTTPFYDSGTLLLSSVLCSVHGHRRSFIRFAPLDRARVKGAEDLIKNSKVTGMINLRTPLQRL